MPSFQEIYAHHADRYEELIAHEDRARSLDAALDRVLGGRPEIVVELGCGTGRVTRLLSPRAERVRAYDGYAHMVEHARAHLSLPNVSYGVADNGALPEADGAADVVVAGWTIGHVTGFFPEAWEEHARRAVNEMRRIARPAGRIVILETMGTCVESAGPPNERLARLYAMFEGEFGLSREVIETSYELATVEEAARVLGFFFGEPMAEKVRARGSAIVPEWTGVWSGAIAEGPATRA
jgi:ubiquinone/menaquinone biosynthesis C-methylase UbiE